MKVTCRYSAVEFRAEHFNFSILGEHPIFLLETPKLISLYKVWLDHPEKLSATEVRLLFIALLKATDLVSFQVAAKPSFQQATKHLPELAGFVAFRQTIPNVEIKFPHIVINGYTNDCSAVGTWLDTWGDRKIDWLDNYKQEHINLKLQTIEEQLHRLIHSPMGDQARKIGRLANWALIASDTPKEKWEYWTSLFKLKGLELYKAKTEDLEYLLEFMEDELPHGGVFSFETLRHIRELYARNKAGLLFGLGGNITEDDLLDPLALTANSFSFIDDDVESINKRIAAASAPVKEPVLADYPDKVSYLRAKSAWILASAQIQAQLIVEQREMQHLTKIALENPGEDGQDETSSASEQEIRNIIENGG